MPCFNAASQRRPVHARHWLSGVPMLPQMSILMDRFCPCFSIEFPISNRLFSDLYSVRLTSSFPNFCERFAFDTNLERKREREVNYSSEKRQSYFSIRGAKA